MIDNDRALWLLEDAERETPFCSCGRPTVPVGQPGGVWLECSGLQGRAMRRPRWLVQLGAAGHYRRLVVDLTPDSLAA